MLSFIKMKRICSLKRKGTKINICILMLICLTLVYLLESYTSLVTLSSNLAASIVGFKDNTHISKTKYSIENEKSNGFRNETSMDTAAVPDYPTKFVLINTYMRAGSTVVGSLLGHHDNAFYFYEPLWKMHTYRFINGSKVCEYTRPYCHESNGAREISLNYISDIFNCKLRQHANKYSPSMHFKGGHVGPKWKAYQDCVSKKQSSKSTNAACLDVMDNVCNSSTYRVIKSLRLSLMDTAYFLEKYPNLYVFQLVRDPRSIINSHIFTSWYPVVLHDIRRITDDVKTQCGRLRDDIKASKPLLERYPRRLRIIQYEDLATDIWKIKTLYKLIGLDKLPNMDDYVNKTIHRRFDSSKVTKQKPSFPRYFGYRDSLPYHIVKLVQDHCADVIQQLGFNIFETEEELRNPNISSIHSRLPFEL